MIGYLIITCTAKSTSRRQRQRIREGQTLELPLIEAYLAEANSDVRLSILQKMRDSQVSLPISLSSDLLKLKLNTDEHISILKTTSAKHKLAFEDYLSSQLMTWDQNVASAALWEWATRTDCIMWHRTLPLSLSDLTPQRIRYTLLDLAWFGGGYPLISHMAEMEGIKDMSSTFLSLLCFRASQFRVNSELLLQVAKKGIEDSSKGNSAADKTLPYFLCYVFSCDPAWVKSQKVYQSFSGIWSQFLNAHKEGNRWIREIKAINDFIGVKSKQSPDGQVISDNWPSLWERHHISADILVYMFDELSRKELPSIAEQSWEFFAGIPQEILRVAVLQCEGPKAQAFAFNIVGSLLDYPMQNEILDNLRMKLKSVENPSELLTLLLPRYSALLNAGAGGNSVFSRIISEREKTIAAFETGVVSERSSLGLWEKEFLPEEVQRQNFFALAYHNTKFGDVEGDDFWSQLSHAWLKPSPDKIEALSAKARQAPAVFQICFIDTLGRFKGNDTAALKLLDFIRSQEEPVLRSLVYALQGIGTVRASQELVAFLTRPNVSPNLQLEISQILKDLDVSHLQAELRSALNDLNYRTLSSNNLLIELRDAISSLLVIDEPSKTTNVNVDSSQKTPTTADLDKLLQHKIKGYDKLSSEVKRALRTAQFFHLQVEQVSQLGTIDLSPAIDMQYKALEICFRENFEQSCSDLIRQGILQRKLDVIGYARPIQSAMDDFEQYIESLPIIHTIPFFSRFKLRKMLRAICQFRPGKRFTLDGLKAFAIFFICFSRSECRYGLARIFPINSMNQEQLFNFCKELHIFQDFRNRAAHEGFHPDASNNLDSIWNSTAAILQGMTLIANELEKQVQQQKGQIIRKIG